MSISEEWPEFVTPEAISRNTGVWPMWVPKPRLRWRHATGEDWLIRRSGERLNTAGVIDLERAGAEAEAIIWENFK